MGLRGDVQRIFVTWPAALVLGGGVAWAEAPSNSTPLDLFEYSYQAEVIAVSPPGPAECRRADDVVATTVFRGPKPLACEPDPFDRMCSQLSSEITDRRRWLDEKARKFDEEGLMLYRRYRAIAEKKFGALESGRKDPEFKREYFSFVIESTESALAEKSRAAVERNVKRALEVFLRTLRESRVLSNGEKVSTEKLLRQCARNPKLNLTWLRQWNGALFSSAFPPYFDNPLERGMRVDPVAGGLSTCELSLSGMSWIECSEGRPECFGLLFHEFAHVIDSCTFYRMGGTQDKILEFIPGDGTLADPYRKSRRKILEFGAERANRLAGAMKDASSCLEQLAAEDPPRHAIPNRCDSEPSADHPVRNRCPLESQIVPGYPSQWSEAEADFWGASAMATWLSESYIHPHGRHKALNRIVANWCSNRQAVPLMENKLANAFFEDYEPKPRKGESKKESPDKALPECRARPVADVPKPLPAKWNDSHSETKTRINRFMLRNTDLRRALGCEPGQVALTCSPKGIRTLPLPR